MSKRMLLLLIALFLIFTASITGTLAYLVTDDQVVNVMTVGRVEIKQNEQEQKTAGTLDAFAQNKPLLPAVYPGDGIPLDEDPANWPGTGTAWQTLSAYPSVQDKFVTVTNQGDMPAYVRTIIAYEAPEAGAIGGMIHLHHNTAATLPDVFLTENPSQSVTVDGTRYEVYVYTYKQPLAAKATTVPSLKQLYMDKFCDNSDLAALGETYEVLALSQAVQTDPFQDAQTALDSGFGQVTEANLHQWLAALTGSDSSEPPAQPPVQDDQPVQVSSMTELNVALAKVPQGGSIVIQLADGAYTSPTDATGKKITLRGSRNAILTLTTGDSGQSASDTAFAGSDLQLEGITLQGAKTGANQGYACASLTMKDCQLLDQLTLCAPSAFTGCTFTEKTGMKYCIETNGQDVTFTGCTFNTYGRAVHVTNPGQQDCTLRATGCQLNDGTKGQKGKAAFVLEPATHAKAYTLIFDQCTLSGFKEESNGIDTNTPLWSYGGAVSKDLLSVTIDGEKVY